MELDTLCEKFELGDISKEDFIDALKKMRAFSKTDRFKLKVVDNAPFSMWACDEEYIIRYWECECERIYGYSSEQAIGKRFLELFVAEPERNQAELECTKIIEGRSAPGEFINNMAVDFDSLGRDVTLMTNCFPIFDDESQKWLQAEIALPTDVEKVVQKHADMLRNYQKLQSTIVQYENDKKSFLESVGARVKDLTAVARKILNSRKKSILQAEDIEKLGTLQSFIAETKRKIIDIVDEKLKIIQEAKSIEQCTTACDDYMSCKNVCRQMLDDIQDYLDDIVEELKVESITHTIELNQARNEAIIECDAEGNTLLLRINNLIQIAFDTSDNLSFRSNNDIPRQKVEQYTSYVGDVQKLLSSVKAKISQCITKAQIADCCAEFTANLHKIEKRLDRNEESV